MHNQATNKIGTAVLPLLLMLSTASAQTPEFTPPTPGPEHTALADAVGTWESKTQLFMAPDAEPEVSTGTETNTMLGGFWLATNFEGTMMGAPYQGHGMYGYDPVKKKYVGTWTDSMSPHMMTMEGEKAANGDLVLMGTGIDCMTKQPMTCKMITRNNADGTRTFEMHAPGPDGQMMKVMQIEYTKKE